MNNGVLPLIGVHVVRGASLSWYHFQRDPYRIPGFSEAVTQVSSFVERNGPFDGIMAFSQGACTAALLALMSQHPDSTCTTD